MRGILRDRLYNKHYDKLLSTRSDRAGSSINTISSVTVLAPVKYVTELDITKTRQFFDGMQITLHFYLLREKGEHISDFDRVSIINIEDCEWYGVPTQEILINWLSNKTDLLIMNDPDRLPIMRYLCAASNSKLKSTVHTSDMSRDHYDIDMWIDAGSVVLSLTDLCKRTYETLSKLGVGPPVIG